MNDDYARPAQEYEDQFKILDKIKAKLPRFSPDEVEDDIAHAIAQVRKKRSVLKMKMDQTAVKAYDLLIQRVLFWK